MNGFFDGGVVCGRGAGSGLLLWIFFIDAAGMGECLAQEVMVGLPLFFYGFGGKGDDVDLGLFLGVVVEEV